MRAAAREWTIERKFLAVMGAARGADRPPVAPAPPPPPGLLWQLIASGRALGASEVEVYEGVVPRARMPRAKRELDYPALDAEQMRSLLRSALGFDGLQMLGHIGVASRVLMREGLMVQAGAVQLPPNRPPWLLLRVRGTYPYDHV